MKQEGRLQKQNLVQKLEAESKGLIIMKKDREIYSSTESGIAGLLKAIEKVEPASLKDSIVG